MRAREKMCVAGSTLSDGWSAIGNDEVLTRAGLRRISRMKANRPSPRQLLDNWQPIALVGKHGEMLETTTAYIALTALLASPLSRTILLTVSLPFSPSTSPPDSNGFWAL